MIPTARLHADALRTDEARTAARLSGYRLTPAAALALSTHSEHECESCGATGLVYLLHTNGADPTTWLLCRTHHPNPTPRDLSIDHGYAEFLIEPVAATYAEHCRILHEDEPPWNYATECRACATGEPHTQPHRAYPCDD